MRSAKEQDIISNLKHCINANAISSHCRPINRVILSFSYIKFKLYQCYDMACFWDIVLISGHCIYFETWYLFRDFVFISRHRSKTSYSFQESAYISVFPSHWKEALKKNRNLFLKSKFVFEIKICFQNWNLFSKSKFVFKIKICFQNRNLFSKSKFDT